MTSKSATRAALLVLMMTTAACGTDAPPTVATGPSPFVAQVGGVWRGQMLLTDGQLVAGSSDDCLKDIVDEIFAPIDQGTVSIVQNGSDLTATMTSASNGLGCTYQGTATLNTVAMNASACDATARLVRCTEDGVRELRWVGSSITATVNGGVVSADVTTTYNVFIPALPPVAVGGVTSRYQFQGTRQ